AGYQEDDGSWVFSPSYDISAFEKPMVVFKGHYKFAQNDGAIMEYSVDNGASWNILGRYINGDEEGTGIYWYGTLDIRADPGDQRFEGNLANASGWGFPSAMIDGQGEGFVSSIRHKLDEIPVNGRQNVRFRFHFAATSANGAPGIVFDDFAIVERGRISLIEQFSNSNSNQDRGGFVQGQYTSLALNNEVNARLDSTLLNNNDLVAVNYYTEIYGNDPLFEVNEEGPSARTLFYGLNNVTSILDGDVLEGTNLSTEAASPPWSGAESNRNTLRDAEFDLQLVLNSSDNDEISVTVEVTPQKDFVGNDIRVYLAVVEKVLTGEVLPNGEFDPRNVFRKFLPSPLGHEVNDLNEGSVTTLTETWKIDARKVLDPDQLAIVAFVQKANGDREVYQAARVDINGKTSILGVGDLIEVDDLNLYPNPANDAFFVTFDLTLEEDFQWRLFDQTGRLMKNGQVFKGMDGFRVESAGLPSGLYLMSIGNETKQYTHLKVIVKH
ncbi:MAG: Omp28-related outer membrane protein, partial [Cyclobacteriaceae bacterium]